MKQKLYQVDAFTSALFGGNPAAVCPLQVWPDDALLQAIAAENNLSETAFYVPAGDRYELRWFTPVVEVDLCGHATLATAYVLFEYEGHTGDRVLFSTRSGELAVSRDGSELIMDFPAIPIAACEPPAALGAGLGHEPAEVLAGSYYVAVYPEEALIRGLEPDFSRLGELERPVAVTAAGETVDFVSRFFAPGFGIDEDPVTGSAHCLLAPYWAGRLQKQELSARQLSARGGEVRCTVRGERVLLAGRAVLYLAGEITLPG